MKHIILIILQILIVSSCTYRDKHDVRLTKVEELTSQSPMEALDSLEVIDYGSLSDDDRHYYDFLQIKASDKAGIRHTSDNLILDVIDYAFSHKKKDRIYVESLYYGGRAYSDLGENAQALEYFQQVLERLPQSPKNLDDKELRRDALRESGKSLNELCLYQEAASNLELAISSDKELDDTLGEINDLQLLGETFLKLEDLDKAQHCFTQACELSQNFDPTYQSLAKMSLASVKYHKNQFDSARGLIHNIPESVPQSEKSNTLALAAMIYKKAGVSDSAYYYASELLSSEDIALDKINRKTGLSVMLSPELRPYITNDSIMSYMGQYRELVEEMLSENERELAQIQQAKHNYTSDQRVKEKKEDHKLVVIGIILGTMFVILKNRNKRVKTKLNSALGYVQQLEQNLSKWDTLVKKENKRIDSDIKLSSISNETTQDLKEKLRNKLLDIYNSNDQQLPPLNPRLIQSEAYQNLQELIEVQKELKDTNPLWKDLENGVYEVSPNFKNNLQLLVSGRLTSFDLKTAILIKYGVTPTQMATLFSRSKSAISSRRESLSQRIFDSKVPSKAIDAIIRLM